MSVEFSEHAEFQLEERRISRKRIIETVRYPQETLPSHRRRKLRRRLFGGKLLQVVTVTEGSRITVISAYYLRRTG